MINYGLAYGMKRVRAWRLRLDDHFRTRPQEFIDSYFAAFPQIRDYLGPLRSARAAAEGFTETLLGRRRYIPELPRLPIRGS